MQTIRKYKFIMLDLPYTYTISYSQWYIIYIYISSCLNMILNFKPIIYFDPKNTRIAKFGTN